MTRRTIAKPCPALVAARCRAALEDPYGTVETVRAANPTLCWHGVQMARERPQTEAERYAKQEHSRAEMTDARSLAEFGHAGEFLLAHTWALRATVNRTFHSYGWKHVAERWAGQYVSNGMFLAACHAAGLTVVQVEPGSPNAFVNLSQRARHERLPVARWSPPPRAPLVLVRVPLA